MARECPTKLGKPGPNIGYGRENIPSPNQGQMETRRKKSFKLEKAVSGGRREACSISKGQCYNEATNNDVIKSIKVTRKLPDGVYIRGSVQGYPLLFTTDTGASKTIISNRVFESLKPEDRQELEKTSKLIGASGVSIKERGKGIFCLKLGSVKMEVEAMVAEIDDDGLLGVDILQNGKNGPADLLMSKGVLMIDKKEIPIIKVGVNNRVRKVTTADHFDIPAQTECVIDVYIERREYDDFSSEKEYVVEQTDHFQAEYPLQMASTLVHINRACTCKVRMLNPFPTAMSIKQDAVIGRAEPIEGIPIVITNEEDSSGRENHVTVRRIKFVTSEHAQSLPEYTTRRVQAEDSTEIPSHLVDLYEKTSQGLNDEQKQKVANLLGRFKDSFFT